MVGAAEAGVGVAVEMLELELVLTTVVIGSFKMGDLAKYVYFYKIFTILPFAVHPS